MIQSVVKEVFIKILLSTLGIMALALLVYMMIDYSKSDIADFYAGASTALESKSVNVSKMQFRQEYEEVIEGGSNGLNGSTVNGVGQGVNLNRYYTNGKLDTSSSKVYNLLASSDSFKNKASVLAIVYDTLMEKYDNVNFTVGVMANVYAEGSFGIVEYKYSRGHSAPWDSSRWSGSSSGNCKIQTKGDIEYLQSLGGGCSVGVGMIQWSFGRRVNLCNRYLAYLSNTQELPFEPYSNGTLSDEFLMYVEVQFMLEELDSASYSNMVQACLDASSVEQCADIVCRQYEAPDNVTEKSAMRQGIATNLANLLMGGR